MSHAHQTRWSPGLGVSRCRRQAGRAVGQGHGAGLQGEGSTIACSCSGSKVLWSASWPPASSPGSPLAPSTQPPVQGRYAGQGISVAEDTELRTLNGHLVPSEQAATTHADTSFPFIAPQSQQRESCWSGGREHSCGAGEGPVPAPWVLFNRDCTGSPLTPGIPQSLFSTLHSPWVNWPWHLP